MPCKKGRGSVCEIGRVPNLCAGPPLRPELLSADAVFGPRLDGSYKELMIESTKRKEAHEAELLRPKPLASRAKKKTQKC